MNTIKIYIDGACRGNGHYPNVGAYGACLQNGDQFELITSGCVEDTTNNQMELKSLIAAYSYILSSGSPDNKYEIYSDSSYIVNGNNLWLPGWIRKGFVDVANVDLWKSINNYLTTFNREGYSVTLIKVKGHSDNQGNTYIDNWINRVMDTHESNHKSNLVDDCFDYPESIPLSPDVSKVISGGKIISVSENLSSVNMRILVDNELIDIIIYDGSISITNRCPLESVDLS